MNDRPDMNGPDRAEAELERRLRSALHARAADVMPDPRMWQQVQSRVARTRMAQWAGAGAVVAVVVVVVAFSVPNFLTAERNIGFTSDVATTPPDAVEPSPTATPAAQPSGAPPAETAAPGAPADNATAVPGSEGPAVADRPPSPAPGGAGDPATQAPADDQVEGAYTVDVALLGDASGCGDGVVTVTRAADRAHPLSDAVGALLEGPTAEEQATGLATAFAGATADMVRSVNLADGLATVDFDPQLTSVTGGGGASSCQALAMLAQLDATVGQFETVDRVTYRLIGSSERFGQWLQIGADEVIERPVP